MQADIRALHSLVFLSITMQWQTSRFLIDLSRPQVMGIVNITPDSFSDGGRWADTHSAMRHCDNLVSAGADMLDLGAESTRPGAPAVLAEDELARLMPVLAHALTLGVPVSVDTYKPVVMRAALEAGADIINDIWALRQPATENCPSALDVVSGHPNCGVCLMHMHREPSDMQLHPMQGDVLQQVNQFLELRVQSIQALGVNLNRIFIDPGIGFGKTAEQNLRLLARQQDLLQPGVGLLAGWSRKSALAAALVLQGVVTDLGAVADERRVPSVTAALIAVQRGAHVVRVHDVKETVQMLAVWGAVNAQNGSPLPPQA